ncbi:hypothetical protein JAAARDRAFT_28343 [Jaapia argillacea MUCL 33604]|uniref:Protein kinase domain-containing protein n=1 Tax=Jaapia argillacea MUCL 33604 TaxID=933084 RepID=A0A067QCK5_9AGAM|nr:hypothetical protein JAAARDRAFT_28343 [Jaapia argillacea MUCL 33604]
MENGFRIFTSTRERKIRGELSVDKFLDWATSSEAKTEGVGNISIQEVIWCKMDPGQIPASHEYLVLLLDTPDVAIRIERDSPYWVTVLGPYIKGTRKDIITIAKSTSELCKPTDIIATLKFPPSSVKMSTLTALLELIIQSAKYYNVYTFNCWWFAARIWENLAKCAAKEAFKLDFRLENRRFISGDPDAILFVEQLDEDHHKFLACARGTKVISAIEGLKDVSTSIAASFEALQKYVGSETSAHALARETMEKLILENRENQQVLVTIFNAELDTSGDMTPTGMKLEEKDFTQQPEPVCAISASLDLLQGIYLDQVVDLKRLRPVNDRSRALPRFIREARLWAKVWEVDGGERTVPFYGFICNEGSLPMLVSPYFEHGNAIDYVNDHPDVDHRALVLDIAKGLSVLHAMQPNPIAHGGLRGMNVKILVTGRSTVRALLSDFGLSKLITDLGEESFSMISRVEEYPRWFAPELTEGSLTIKADVYAWSMTAIELLTHQRPFPWVKSALEVSWRVLSGQRPMRPLEYEDVQRGLDFEFWGLLVRCWAEDREARPSIEEVVEALSPREVS